MATYQGVAITPGTDAQIASQVAAINGKNVAPATTPAATNATPATAYKNLNVGSYDTTGDTMINQGMQNSLTNSAPINEGNIYNQKLSEYQSQVDAVNKIYAQKLAETKVQGQNNLGSGRAIQARSGTLGSDFATSQNANITTQNNNAENLVTDEQSAKVAAILGLARKDAADEIAAKRAAQQSSTKDYLDFLGAKTTRQQTNAQKVAQAMLDQGVDTTKVDPNQLSEIAKTYGINTTDITGAYTTLKKAADDAATKKAQDAQKASDEHNKATSDLGFTVGKDQQHYSYDPKTGKYTLTASGPESSSTTNPAGGASNVNGSGLSQDALDQQAQNYLITGKLSTLGNGGAKTKVAILNRAAELAQTAGGVPAAAAKYAAAANATKTRTESLTKLVSSASNLEAQIPRLAQLADQVNSGALAGTLGTVGGSHGRSFSAAIKQRFGDDTAARYEELINTVRSDYASMQAAVAGSKGAEYFSRAADQAIPTGLTGSQYLALLDTLKTSSANSQKAVNAEIDNIVNTATSRPSSSPASTAATGSVSVIDPAGGTHVFPNQAAADSFKKAAGIK